VGESLTIVDTSACCIDYVCTCDMKNCPAAPLCAYGYQLVTIANDCCDEYKCVCDDKLCPSSYVPECSGAGYVLQVSGYISVIPSLAECCAATEQYECVCDQSQCAGPQITCAAHELMITVPGDCCPTYECICDYSKCPSSVPPTCDDNKQLTSVCLNDCCTTYSCQCKKCEEPITCPAGYDSYEETDDCGCVKRTCCPPEQCVYDDKVYAHGDTWTVDECTTCCCVVTADGTYKSECSTLQCSTCQVGYTLIPVEGQCCGECVPDSCVSNGKTYSVGQTWSPTDDKCNTCVCRSNPLTGAVYTECSVPSCPAFDESCPVEFIKYSADGCCRTCERQDDGCGVKIDYTDYIEVDGCVSDEQVDMTLCSGTCTSASVWSEAINSYHKQCSCCTATSTETKDVKMTCPDGRKYTHQLVVATQCSCMASKCQDGN